MAPGVGFVKPSKIQAEHRLEIPGKVGKNFQRGKNILNHETMLIEEQTRIE